MHNMGYGKDNKINVLDYQNIPHSLGMVYATFTSLLGYLPDSDEWKVMAIPLCNCKITLLKLNPLIL